MSYKIKTNAPPDFSFCENDTVKSVLQNVFLIITTKKGTIPMYRNFGLPMNFVDKPLTLADTIAANEIRNALLDFEPRAIFIDVKLAQEYIEVEVEI